MIKLIIFDWDDTFTLGATDGYLACYHEALISVGIYLSAEEERARVLPTWGTSHVKGLEALLPDNPELVLEAVKKYEEYFFGDTFTNALQIIPGSVDLLKRLAGKYTLAIATGLHPKILKEHVFPRFHVPNVFAEIISSYDLDDPGKGKPHPHMPETIMQSLGIKPEETILVGDGKNDILMARAAKITPVLVLTGHTTRREGEEMGVKYIIEDVTKLEDVLEQFNA